MANGIREIAKSRGTTFNLAPSDIHINEGWNCRDMGTPEAKADHAELVESIREHGVKEPVTVVVEDGVIYLTNGHRRHAAVLDLIEQGHIIETIPAIKETDKSGPEEHILSQIVRNSGKPFSPMETARVYRRLADLDLSVADIARKVSKSTEWVRQLLDLESAPVAVTELVRTGKVSPTLAAERLKKNKGDGKAAGKELKEAVKVAESEGKTKASAKHVRKVAEKKAGKEKPVAETKRKATKEASIKEQLSSLYRSLNLREAITQEDDHFIVRMTADQYATFRVLAGK